jgi:hypothetical protein
MKQLDRRWGVVALAVLVRVFFIVLTPSAAVSTDLSMNWTAVARRLGESQNPYNATDYLNWPPLWMQLIYVLHRVAESSGLPWFRTVQLFTAALDVVGLTIALMSFVDAERGNRALLYAWALNPSAVLIACQHCNIDGLVAIWCVLAVASLMQFGRSRSAIDWLFACLFVGLGILTKTVPLVLVPLLAGGARVLDTKTRSLGSVLIVGPAALGISIIYVLGPEHISAKVLGYRSAAGWYGISGLLHWLGAQRLVPQYARIFQGVLALAASWLATLAWRGRLARAELIVAAGYLLLIVPTLGPGYGPQYVAWSLPFLALTLPLVTGASRAVLVAQLMITAGTLIIEYGLFPSHGALWLQLSSSTRLAAWSAAGSSEAGQTAIRIPLFVISLVWLGICTQRFARLGAVSSDAASCKPALT